MTLTRRACDSTRDSTNMTRPHHWFQWNVEDNNAGYIYLYNAATSTAVQFQSS